MVRPGSLVLTKGWLRQSCLQITFISYPLPAWKRPMQFRYNSFNLRHSDLTVFHTLENLPTKWLYHFQKWPYWKKYLSPEKNQRPEWPIRRSKWKQVKIRCYPSSFHAKPSETLRGFMPLQISGSWLLVFCTHVMDPTRYGAPLFHYIHPSGVY